jgi:hypothetical protein
MPILKIEVPEYQCVHCGYKWINRINGKDGLIPKRCAKCKRQNWNGDSPERNPITPKERGLRTRLHRFEGYDPRKGTPFGGSTSYRPNELCKKFLDINPRPTMKELQQALYPLGWNPHRYQNFVPDPDKAEWLKYDEKEYKKILKQEAQKRREIMQQIIDSRD